MWEPSAISAPQNKSGGRKLNNASAPLGHKFEGHLLILAGLSACFMKNGDDSLFRRLRSRIPMVLPAKQGIVPILSTDQLKTQAGLAEIDLVPRT